MCAGTLCLVKTLASELIHHGPCLYPPHCSEQQGEKQCCADWNVSHWPRSASSLLLVCWSGSGSDVPRPPERCREKLVENSNRGTGLWPGAGRNRCLHMLCFQRNYCDMLSPGLSAHGVAVGASPGELRPPSTSLQLWAADGRRPRSHTL